MSLRELASSCWKSYECYPDQSHSKRQTAQTLSEPFVGAKKRTRTSTPFRALEPEFSQGSQEPSAPRELGSNDVRSGETLPEAEADGPAIGPILDIDQALAFALTEATKAGQWDVVARLAGELQARRKSTGVAPSNSEGSSR